MLVTSDLRSNKSVRARNDWPSEVKGVDVTGGIGKEEDGEPPPPPAVRQNIAWR